MVLIGGLITMLVQCFFALRLWRVLKNRTIGLLCCTLAILRFVGSILASVEAITSPTLAQFSDKWSPLITTLLVIGACVDVMIAGTMCYALRKQRDGAFTK